jgi:hypothetical protein
LDSLFGCPAIDFVEAIDEVKSYQMKVLLNITMEEGNIGRADVRKLSMLGNFAIFLLTDNRMTSRRFLWDESGRCCAWS